MSILDNIVSLGLCPDEAASLSGFQLIKAPGISIKTLADTANETYVRGTELAMEKKALALTMLTNDFIGALQGNKVVATISNPEYNSSQFNTGASVTASNTERGVVLHKAPWKGSLRGTYIKSVEVFPLSSGDVDLKIYDGYNTYTYPVTLVGGQVNVFNEEQLEGFPFKCNSAIVKILINQTSSYVSAPITCMKGCGGSTPNPCGWADGWDGTKYVRSEGYGINVNFYCECNYEQILCDLAKGYSGELIWLKWQQLILEEQEKSSRFSNWVIYGADKIRDQIQIIEGKYTQKWNQMMEGMMGILKTYRDDCLNCQGKRWVTNL